MKEGDRRGAGGGGGEGGQPEEASHCTVNGQNASCLCEIGQ